MTQTKRTATSSPSPTEALFVRIPVEHARRLDRAAFELRRPKRALVSELVERYIDPDSPASLAALAGSGADGRPLARPAPQAGPRAEAGRRRITVETLEPDTMVVGRHSFRPSEPEQSVAPGREVLSGEQAAELLQVTPEVVQRLAAQGELPGRTLAGAWRFSRAALLAWLAHGAGGGSDGAGDRER